MPVISYSIEEVEKIKKKIEEKKEEKSTLEKYDVKDMWRDDLENFLKILEEIEN